MLKEVVEDKTVFFYDGFEKVMSIGFQDGEFIWWFNDNKKLEIVEGQELYKALNQFMKNRYTFDDTRVLKDYKDDNKLIWYSDQAYNPDDAMSRESISYLTVEFIDNKYYVSCINPLDEKNNCERSHFVSFLPAGNGKPSRNEVIGSRLQDDFVIDIYDRLLNRVKIRQMKNL